MKKKYYREYEIENFHTVEEKGLIRSRGLREMEAIKWVDSLAKWKWFVLLTFKYDVTRKQAENALGQWQLWVNEALFPKGSNRRLRVYPSLETCPDSGRYHWHLLIEDISTLKLKKTIGNTKQDLRHWIWKKWRKLNVSGIFPRTNGKDWFEEIEFYDTEYLADYVLKQLNETNNVISPQYISV